MRIVPCAAAAGLLWAAALTHGTAGPPAAALPRTSDLTAAPDGERIGVLLPGAPVQVIERSGDWARVSLEGWVLWPEAPPASPTEAPHGPLSSPAPAAAADSPARVTGAVFVSVEGGRGVVGTRVVVRLVRSPEEATAAMETVRRECETRRAELRAEAERLDEQAGRAMKTIESTTVAFDTYDEAKRAQGRVLRELRQHDRRCGERAEEALESFTQARALTDGQGRYTIEEAPPGRYLVHATLEAEKVRHVWEVDLEAGAGARITLDLSNANRSRVEPVADYR